MKWCRFVPWLDHDWEYTGEYVNDFGNVQADRVCSCGVRELAWTGPKISTLMRMYDADDLTEVPGVISREEAGV